MYAFAAGPVCPDIQPQDTPTLIGVHNVLELLGLEWCARGDSNARPSDPESYGCHSTPLFLTGA